MIPPRIIVNADDLGMSASVNAAIRRGMGEAWITSATILANAPAVDEALTVAQDFPECSFGAHLNLTAFRPLSGAAGLGHLLNASGELQPSVEMRLGLSDLKAVIHEWDAQLRRLSGAGLPITHFDSHHHVHTHPLLLPAVKTLQGRYEVHRVRKTRNIIPLCREDGPRRTAKLLLKGMWNGALQRISPRATTVDLFGSVTDFVERARELPPVWWSGRTIELMCHPGHSGAEFVQECRWLRQGLATVVGFEIDFDTYHAAGFCN